MKKIGIILGITALFMSSCAEKETNNKQRISKKIKVETIKVEKSETTQNLNYSGIITPSVNTPLGFQLPGSVSTIYFDEGDIVTKGQILAEIDKTSYQGAYEVAMAMKTQAEDAYTRLKTVYDNGSLPEIQWEDVKSKLEQAKSSAKIAKQNLNNCQIISPADGIIGNRNIEIGSTAVPGFTILNLVSIDEVFVKISVPENEINQMRKKQMAEVVIPAIGENIYQAKVEKIGVMANPISKTYEVKLRLKNQSFEIKPGMVCDVNMTIQNTNSSFSIPYKAVLTDNNAEKFVYVVHKESQKAKKQIIEIDRFSNNELLVSSGLHDGDLVVVEGQHKLKDQNPITL